MAERDRYESEYMPGGGEVLLRDKFVGRKAQLWVAIPALWCFVGAIASFANVLPKSSPAVGVMMLGLTAFFALLTVGLGVVRTVVSERELHVQLGFWGPRVPIERIRDCRVVDYDWVRFGGWGIKRDGEGTWAYVLGAKRKVVEVVWQDEDGVEKKAQFSAGEPAEVVAAVQRARERGAKKLRIAEPEAEPSREIEEELEGDLDARSRQDRKQS